MKKTLLTLLAASAVLLSLASCKKPTDTPADPETKPEHVAQVVDYRNKDASGNACRAAESDTPAVLEEISWKLLDKLEPFDTKYENGEFTRGIGYSNCSYTGADGKDVICDPVNNKETYNKMKNAIKFEDHKDGVKLVFTKPAGYDKVTWIVFQYVDGNGNRSTCIDRNDWGTFFDGTDGSGNFELVYPLVKKGQKANFWVMLGNGNDAQPDVSFFYEVMPAHGKKVVDDMQSDYRETDYLSMEDGHTAKVKLSIPPYAKTLKTMFVLHEQNGGTYPWYDGDVNKLGVYVYEDAEALKAAQNGTKHEFNLDLSEKVIETVNGNADFGKGFGKNLYKDNSHVFVSLTYQYTLEDAAYDGYYFTTPEVKSMPVANDFFKTE